MFVSLPGLTLAVDEIGEFEDVWKLPAKRSITTLKVNR